MTVILGKKGAHIAWVGAQTMCHFSISIAQPFTSGVGSRFGLQEDIKIAYTTGQGPWHIYSRGLPGLASVGEDVPNPQETWGPRDRGFLLWREHPFRNRGDGMEWGTVRGEQWLIVNKYKYNNNNNVWSSHGSLLVEQYLVYQ